MMSPGPTSSREQRLVVVLRQPRLLEHHAGLQRVLDPRAHVLEIHHGDAVGRHVDVAAHERQRALARRIRSRA